MLPSRKRTQGGASLCPGLSHFAPLGRTDREQARGQRREARGNSQTAGKLWCDPPQVSKDHAKRGDCPRVFLKVRPCFYPKFSRRSCLCLAERPRKPPRFGPNGSSRANDPLLPSRKRTQGGASLCPGLSPFAPLRRTDRSTRKSSVIAQQATEVLRLQLRPRCKQEQRDNADTAVMQAARCRVRAELRKGK